jgi:iron(III) transport system substrate-binding protein
VKKLLVSSVVLIVLSVSACSGDGSSADTKSSASSAPGPTTAGPSTTVAAETAVAIEASHSEGGLTIYGNPNDNQMQPVIEAFSAAYGWIDVQYISLGGADSFQRYLTESSTKSRTADVLIDSDAVGLLDLVKRGEIVDYVDPNVPNLPAFARLAPGVVAMSEDPLIAVFNKTALPEDKQPTTLAELATYAAANKGKVATYPIENALGYAGTFAYTKAKGEDGWSNIEKIGPNAKVEESGAAAFQKITQGEYNAGYFQSGSFRALIVDDTARVASWRYLKDATPVIPRGVAVTKAAASPNSAKVFVNFLLSVPGQTAACAGGFTPYRDGVDCRIGLQSIKDAVGADNLLIGSFDPAMVAEQQSIVDRWKKAFGR